MKKLARWEKRRTIALLLVCAVLVSSIAYFEWPKAPKRKDNVFIFIERANGNTETFSTHNVITDIGENYDRDILGFNNVTNHNATIYVTLSNDASPAVTWTKLANELSVNGCGRVQGNVTAWVNSGDYAYNVTAKFYFTGTTIVQTCGEQWSAEPLSDNNLYAVASFTQTTFNNGDSFTGIWVNTRDDN